MSRLEQALGITDRPARIQQLRESIARRALARIGTPSDALILQVVRMGSVMIVASEQPDSYFTYGVDSFRLPTPDETDPDQDYPRGLSEWVLIDQHGGFGEDEIDGMMAGAIEYAARLRETAVAA